jgi:hypothetical protein
MTTTTETKLAAMLSFAQSHDWGQQALIPSNCQALHVYDSYKDEVVKFYDMQTLRSWAGY